MYINKKLVLSYFDPPNVINMVYMLIGCSSLKKLNLSNFFTENISVMKHLLSGYSSLKELNIFNFIDHIVDDLSFIFNQCTSLEWIELSGFNAKKSIIWIICFFIQEIKIIFLLDFNTENVSCMKLFGDCSNKLKIEIKTEYKNIK